MKSVLGTFILACALIMIAPFDAFAKGHGTFRVVKGDVQVKSGKNGKTKKAKIGQKVFPKDTVITGKNARAKIVMVDKNVLNVSPDSKIEIEAYEFDPSKKKKNVLLNVLYGKVRSKVKQKYDKKGNKFQVKTKSAVAGVRGTDFIVDYKPPQGPGPGATNVVTFEGQVEFGAPTAGGGIANSVQVNAGQTAGVSGAGAVSEVKSVPKQQLASMDQESNADTATDSGGSNERQPSNSGGDSGDSKDEGGSDSGKSEGGDTKAEGDNGGNTEGGDAKAEGDNGGNAENGNSDGGGDAKAESDGGGNSENSNSEGGGNKAGGSKGQGRGNQAGRNGSGGNRGPASAGGGAGAPAGGDSTGGPSATNDGGGGSVAADGAGRGPSSQPGPTADLGSGSGGGPGALPPPPPVEDVAPIIPDFGGPALDPALNQPVAPDVNEICGQICNETIVDGTARLIITIQN